MIRVNELQRWLIMRDTLYLRDQDHRWAILRRNTTELPGKRTIFTQRCDIYSTAEKKNRVNRWIWARTRWPGWHGDRMSALDGTATTTIYIHYPRLYIFSAAMYITLTGNFMMLVSFLSCVSLHLEPARLSRILRPVRVLARAYISRPRRAAPGAVIIIA